MPALSAAICLRRKSASGTQRFSRGLAGSSFRSFQSTDPHFSSSTIMQSPIGTTVVVVIPFLHRLRMLINPKMISALAQRWQSGPDGL
ncbi:uncharacterized protein BP01DRAFT_132943 [Aspergillus saccharolyticus JOP 1030-1]|uniref:Uncharacterized protein n=1 Tax=Aspergillus saccharolyticus JOP 1030-1 TaxID=1450539 RepID=A0A318Z7U5_9EURO|nr:hypothetical protein BP01DRAFT_132943 [Aspergillus saccharolyticus JOP 1030-1]PYH42477.1 hypothetical protein BP01DRAFT_132943 [Aspergillus saccharolyticus JOP 1030-1]